MTDGLGEPMNLVNNERVKLLASAIDRASTACIAIGLLTPIVSGNFLANTHTIAGVVIWFIAALSLHFGAQQVLGMLKQ